jgi:hypothetical protein
MAWMIMLGNEDSPPHCPVYPSLAYGFYSHVEPVFGILSNSPLTTSANGTEVAAPFFDDDYIVFGTNVNEENYYRQFAKLPDGLTFKCNCKISEYPGGPCIYEKYDFAWAMKKPFEPSWFVDQGWLLLPVGVLRSA